nr:immunoglobulin heavy chain junction region [Mus musculus]MBK4197096.1 immunoglobulin heavy chain junction region [Mus musculus]
CARVGYYDYDQFAYW